jgi:quercetin dioxygenase-like cupin family protein
VQIDSKHYTVELENNRVRVLRIRYGPREVSVMHSHPTAVAVFLSDVHARFTFPHGKTEEQTIRAGDVMAYPAGDH